MSRKHLVSKGGGVVICGLIFEHGHGSACGRYLYIEIHPDLIRELRYSLPDGSGRAVLSQLHLSRDRWREVVDCVERMKLKKARLPRWRKLLHGRKMDGTEYRRLVLLIASGHRVKPTEYVVTPSKESALLERILSDIAEEQMNILGPQYSCVRK